MPHDAPHGQHACALTERQTELLRRYRGHQPNTRCMMGRECLAAGDFTPPSPESPRAPYGPRSLNLDPSIPHGKGNGTYRTGSTRRAVGSYEKKPTDTPTSSARQCCDFMLSREQIRRWGNCGYWPSIMRGRPETRGSFRLARLGNRSVSAAGVWDVRPTSPLDEGGTWIADLGKCPPHRGISYLGALLCSCALVLLCIRALSRSTHIARSRPHSGTTWLGTGAWIPNFLVRSK